jgi:CRP-like cAMP-binding protein
MLRPREGAGRLAAAGPAPRTLEVVRLLEASPLFAGATPRQLLDLAQAAREAILQEGTTLLGENDPSALYLVETGRMAVEEEIAGTVDAGPGDIVGARLALAGVRDGRARVTSPGAALRIDGVALHALLAGDPALLQSVFVGLRQAARPR